MPLPEITEQSWDVLLRFLRRPYSSRIIGESETRLLAALTDVEATGSPSVAALLSPGLMGRGRAVVE